MFASLHGKYLQNFRSSKLYNRYRKYIVKNRRAFEERSYQLNTSGLKRTRFYASFMNVR